MRRVVVIRQWVFVHLVILLCTLTQGASSALAQSSPPDSVTHVATIRLTDGSVLRGRIVAETTDTVVIETVSVGRIRIDRTRIVSITYESETGGPEARVESTPAPTTEIPVADPSTDPDINSVMFGPTPETLPKGSAYFRNFQLLILNFGYGITDDVSLSLGVLFPVSADFQMVSLGFKYRILSRERYPVGLAVAANGAAISDETLATLSGILGVGNPRTSLNLSIHKPFIDDGTDDPAFFILGADVQAGPGFKFLAEYGNSGDAVFRDEDFAGFLSIGLRLFGERSSFTLTGFRPVEVDSDGFIAFPFAMYSRHW